ncbi:MAG: M18 family aminopeptidase, partial [Muribaculaceae bacterium]|nr:M18 family aminopeptidase [Muribaculaceae bacterium]
MKNNNKIQSLLSFLTSSTCNFWAVENISRTLDANGFIHLDQREAWSLVPGGKYYITQNESAIFAFVVGENGPAAPYKIISAHSDSPGFRIKPAPEILSEGNILKLNTEVYGGPILYTWFDRPLSISGRVICRTHDPLRPRTLLVKIERPLLTIPHLAIHYNRSVNEGNPLSKQKDMLPVIARLDNAVQSKDYIIRTIANELEVAPEDIIDADLTLFDITPAMTLGPSDEFIQSGRIDDLEMAHAAMTALLESDNTGSTRVMAIFDNEETGSGTRQGAHSPVLKNLLQRINDQLGGDSETMFRATAGSFM